MTKVCNKSLQSDKLPILVGQRIAALSHKPNHVPQYLLPESPITSLPDSVTTPFFSIIPDLSYKVPAPLQLSVDNSLNFTNRGFTNYIY